MSTLYLKDKDGNASGTMTLADIYRYKGYVFEFHPYCGLVRLKKNMEPSKHQGHAFLDAVEEWSALSTEEQEKTRIYG